MALDAFREANLKNWNDRVPGHLKAWGYNVAGFLDDPKYISGGIESQISEMGSVEGKSLLHLMCQFGTDALSWARLGATVTGMDFSDKAITAAKKLFSDTDTPGRFYVAELYESRSVLDETFDIVYTGGGALCWLPDIKGWAKVMSDFLKPGGTFYINDSHPVMLSLDLGREDKLLSITRNYFETEEPESFDEVTSYAGSSTISNSSHFMWNHGIGEITTALINAGLRIEYVHEFPYIGWQGVPALEKPDDAEWWELPTDRSRLPLSFSIRAVKEA